jgi:prevent-host-death family protein
MGLNIVEDIKTVTELKTNTRGVLHQLHETGRPIVITVKGRPNAVLLGAEDFERRERAVALLHDLMKGERDIQQGRLRPVDDFLRELPS